MSDRTEDPPKNIITPPASPLPPTTPLLTPTKDEVNDSLLSSRSNDSTAAASTTPSTSSTTATTRPAPLNRRGSLLLNNRNETSLPEPVKLAVEIKPYLDKLMSVVKQGLLLIFTPLTDILEKYAAQIEMNAWSIFLFFILVITGLSLLETLLMPIWSIMFLRNNNALEAAASGTCSVDLSQKISLQSLKNYIQYLEENSIESLTRQELLTASGSMISFWSRFSISALSHSFLHYILENFKKLVGKCDFCD